MPIEAYVILSFVVSIFLLIWFTYEAFERWSKKFLIPLLIMIVIWTIIPLSIKPNKVTESEHKVVMIDGVACINVDGEIVNLNHETGRNYQEGELVTAARVQRQYVFFYTECFKRKYL